MPENETSTSQTQESQSTVPQNSFAPPQNVGRIPHRPVATAYLRACDDIVADFRRDRLSRDNVVVMLLRRAEQEREQGGFEDHEQVYRSIAIYMEALQNVDEENIEAGREGGRQRPYDSDLNDEFDNPRERRRSRAKRRRDDDGFSDDESDRIDLSLLPFDRTAPSGPVDVWKLTAQLQENYARDPGLVKKKVLASQQRPRFPASLPIKRADQLMISLRCSRYSPCRTCNVSKPEKGVGAEDGAKSDGVASESTGSIIGAFAVEGSGHCLPVAWGGPSKRQEAHPC
ncbi:hypothetical protein BGW80DRAFT_1564402 [Lactifluus volemus]|nr:hypothetical protein BGW80DRAFT_1564402 [Lactifluus volemus]